MPRTPVEDVIQTSVRLPPVVVSWLQELAVARGGGNVNKVHRRLVEDAWSWYGLPTPLVNALKEDARLFGIDTAEPREYVMHLLTERYAQLPRPGPVGSPKPGK